MELTSHYYQIIFQNGREFFVESTIDNIKSFIYTVYITGEVEDFIALQSEAKTPLYIVKNDIFSIQEVSKELIGGLTRKWKLV